MPHTPEQPRALSGTLGRLRHLGDAEQDDRKSRFQCITTPWEKLNPSRFTAPSGGGQPKEGPCSRCPTQPQARVGSRCTPAHCCKTLFPFAPYPCTNGGGNGIREAVCHKQIRSWQDRQLRMRSHIRLEGGGTLAHTAPASTFVPL